MSVFVPVPYCLDECGFVVEPEVRQVDSSSSILLSQDCFGYSRFFVFPYKSEIICSSSVKNITGSLIGIALTLLLIFVICVRSLLIWLICILGCFTLDLSCLGLSGFPRLG